MAAFAPMKKKNPQLSAKQSVETVIEQIAKYNEYGNALRRARSMGEIAEQLSQIAELAEQTVVNEADDWFDAHTLKRNMSELKKFTSEFAKYANEADILEQRMTALYDDMGHILNRYFEIAHEEPPIEPVATSLPQTKEQPQQPIEEKDGRCWTGYEPTPGKKPYSDGSCQKVSEDDGLGFMAQDHIPPITADTHSVAGHELTKTDILTVRAIQLVHQKLKKENPELAQRFRALPPHKMIKAVWKLVK